MTDYYMRLYHRILEKAKREDRRPWGYYQILSEQTDHKVKRIVIFPGKRISLQRHLKRAENWTIISGAPLVRVEDEELRLKPGDSIQIPKGAKHRISNPGEENAVFIEVQTGEYFGEDDLERFQDDFGRA